MIIAEKKATNTCMIRYLRKKFVSLAKLKQLSWELGLNLILRNQSNEQWRLSAWVITLGSLCTVSGIIVIRTAKTGILAKNNVMHLTKIA